MKETSEGNTPIHSTQRTIQQRDQQFEGLEECDYQVFDPDGGLTLRSHRETCGIQHLRLRQLSGNSTTIGAKVGILGDPHPGLKGSDFFSVQMLFSLARNLNSLAIDRVCKQIHLPHATFSDAQSLHSTDDMCALAQGTKGELRPKIVFIHASCFTLRLTAH